MRISRGTSGTLFAAGVVAMMSVSVVGCRHENEPGRTLKAHETGLRKIATRKVVPQYPSSSLAQDVSGVAVASIVVNVDGQVEKVTILEAPDTDIGRAVSDAVRQWSFPPPRTEEDPTPARMEGKLTFYFEMDRGQGRVLNPDEKASNDASAQDAPWEIREADLEKLSRSARVAIVDIRETASFAREHRKEAINLPYREIDARAKLELPERAVIVIDCYPEMSKMCRDANRKLSSMGFSHVITLIR